MAVPWAIFNLVKQRPISQVTSSTEEGPILACPVLTKRKWEKKKKNNQTLKLQLALKFNYTHFPSTMQSVRVPGPGLLCNTDWEWLFMALSSLGNCCWRGEVTCWAGFSLWRLPLFQICWSVFFFHFSICFAAQHKGQNTDTVFKTRVVPVWESELGKHSREWGGHSAHAVSCGPIKGTQTSLRLFLCRIQVLYPPRRCLEVVAVNHPSPHVASL